MGDQARRVCVPATAAVSSVLTQEFLSCGVPPLVQKRSKQRLGSFLRRCSFALSRDSVWLAYCEVNFLCTCSEVSWEEKPLDICYHRMITGEHFEDYLSAYAISLRCTMDE